MSAAPAVPRYPLIPGESRFTVQAFATGMLSFLGHNPTFAVRTFDGEVWFPSGNVEDIRLRMTIPADALALLDAVKPADRVEIETRMRQEVLQAATYPEITFEAADNTIGRAADQYAVRFQGPLSLRGVTRSRAVDARLVIANDGIRLSGSFSLPQSEYGIRPVTALGGSIRLKDALAIAFDVIGRPAAP